MPSKLAKNALDDLAGLGDGEAGRRVPPSTSTRRRPDEQEEPRAESKSRDVTGYLGHGMYRRKGRGDLKKLSVYLTPDAATALRLAAAAGDDPRGRTMGEIVEALLRSAGYV